jgi:hypothetical protein
VDNEMLARLALAEAEAAADKRRKTPRIRRGDMVRWSDLDRELARHALESLSGGKETEHE